VDLSTKGGKPLRIESAEQYPLGRLARAMILKMLRKLGLPTMGTVTSRAMREQLLSNKKHVTEAKAGPPAWLEDGSDRGTRSGPTPR
jgi:hypothetical protein